jgi:ACS family glucarate transporter-like MFS transporter
MSRPDQLPRSVSPYEVVGLTVGMSLLMYLHRFCISPLTDTIIADLGVNREQFGAAVGAFFYAYAFLQVPAGWLSDRFGSRYTLPCFVAVWSLAIFGLAAVQSIAMLIALRLLLGVGQAGAYPTAAATVKRWIPADQRARCNSAIATGGRAGGLLAMVLTPLTLLLASRLLPGQAQPWRVVLIVLALPGLVWIVWWLVRYREPRRSVAGLGQTPVAATNAVEITEWNWRWICNVGLLGVINVLLNFGWIFLVTWMPSYLGDRFPQALPADEGARVAWIGTLTACAGLAGMAGNLSGGFLTDYLFRRIGGVWSRRIPGIIAGGVAGSLYIAAIWTTDLWLFVILMGGVYFFADLLTGAIWAVYQDIGGGRVAVVLGTANMCGNLGAAAASGWFGALAEQKQWTAVFALASASLLVMAALWFFVGNSPPRAVASDEGKIAAT